MLPLLAVDENDPNVAVIPIRPESPPPPARDRMASRPQTAAGGPCDAFAGQPPDPQALDVLISLPKLPPAWSLGDVS